MAGDGAGMLTSNYARGNQRSIRRSTAIVVESSATSPWFADTVVILTVDWLIFCSPARWEPGVGAIWGLFRLVPGLPPSAPQLTS